MRGHWFDPGPWHTKVVKNGISCSSLGTQTYWVELGLVDPQCQDYVTGCDIMSSVWGMILQWGSTTKVSTKLPVATRHHHDMTEKLLKVTLNTYTRTKLIFCPKSLWQDPHGKHGLSGAHKNQMSRAMRKCDLCHTRTTKVQISLRICAVWSAPLLFAA